MVNVGEGVIIFVAGSVFGSLTTIAAFRATMAVQGNKITTLEETQRDVKKAMAMLTRQMIDLARMCGEKRWSDPNQEGKEE